MKEKLTERNTCFQNSTLIFNILSQINPTTMQDKSNIQQKIDYNS